MRNPRVGSLFMRSELASILYADEILDGSGRLLYIDREVSVSGLKPIELHWDAATIEEQYRRFHNGS